MPRWLRWKNLALVLVVCVGHLALLAGFSHSFASAKPENAIRNTTDILVVNLRPTISKPLAEALTKPRQQTGTADNTAADSPSATKNQKSDLPATPFWSGVPSRTYFLDTDAVDVTAEPTDDFDLMLARLLPLNVEMVVIEFWIEKDGRTVDVRCLEGACTSDVTASLPKLAELVFKPAVKNGEAVANRKVIQIELRPSPGM